MSSLLNKKAVRQFLLDAAKTHRHQPFTRVSEDVFAKAEGALRQWAVAYVKNLPSKGTTIT